MPYTVVCPATTPRARATTRGLMLDNGRSRYRELTLVAGGAAARAAGVRWPASTAERTR